MTEHWKMKGLLLALACAISLAAEIHVVTRNVLTHYPYYTKHIASSMSEFLFKVKGSSGAYIFLTSTELTKTRQVLMYEIIIGKNLLLRLIGGNDTGLILKEQNGSYIKSDNTTLTYLPYYQYARYWLSWKDSRLRLGNGSTVGNETIFDIDISHIGYDINHIGFSCSGNFDCFSSYHDAEPVSELQTGCVGMTSKSQFVPGEMDRDFINDMDLSTCMQVPTSAAGKFLSLAIDAQPPSNIVLRLKDVPSCERSNLIIFDYAMNECVLSDSFDLDPNGMKRCVYSCMHTCSSVVTIGFQKAMFEPQSWLICEIYESRNKDPSMRNFTTPEIPS